MGDGSQREKLVGAEQQHDLVLRKDFPLLGAHVARRHIHIMPELPRNASGKIDKRALAHDPAATIRTG
jgi:acyl-coenzyme A synthetase/AMP-(fatty) acid ligase